ncbi:hypothetical protein [Paenarthrobacter sp. A20]|uniref:hypothetical protein n=1 Tax=Paenarthrobacter sp. A20 TaxID=2817891 RepID=UPI00209EBE81|nr:hypothetical protein [Paenarthrobacter sp. A20]MCP1413684.1 heme/copper-type cytochrome/quinol oxidase subunit 1 [Paenarthrobacter sp. A20]
MDEQQIQEIVDRVIAALEQLKPAEPQAWQVWGAFGSYATLAAAVVAFFIGWWTIKQKREADARAEWWRRTQWALEATASENDALNSYGAGMLDLLARSELADAKDKELLDAVWEVTDTEMQDDSIEQLLEEAAGFGDLDEEEKAVVRSFYNMDGTPEAGDNGARNVGEEADD